MFRYISLLVLLISSLLSQRNSASAQQLDTIKLWPDGAPGVAATDQKEVRFVDPQFGGETIRNVVVPTLTVFLPPTGTANRSAAIVCPGGGFLLLSWNNEGTDVAHWLNTQGIVAFVLKYRAANTGTTDAEFRSKVDTLFKDLQVDSDRAVSSMSAQSAMAASDGRRAVQVVRQNAAKWQIDPARIGMIGFSAGATVTLDVALQHDATSRPNFAASIYGPSLRSHPVPHDAPPLFLAAAADDRLLPVKDSQEVFSGWKAGDHPVELHIYAKGGHGFGMKKRGLPADHWTDQFMTWLSAQGF